MDPRCPNDDCKADHTALRSRSKSFEGFDGQLIYCNMCGCTVSDAPANQRVRDTKRKDQAYDKLYEELRQYKDNFLLEAQKPLFKDVILLFDGMGRLIRTFEERGRDMIRREEAIEAIKHLQDETLEVLYRRDIEPVEERPEKLDIDIQRPIRRVDTDNPDEDRMVDQVVREGFRLNGAILRPQEVIVKRFR